MTLTEWTADVEQSPEYRRELFRMSMAVRYEREEWRQYIIKDFKTRRRNNFRRSAMLTYKAYAKWRFER